MRNALQFALTTFFLFLSTINLMGIHSAQAQTEDAQTQTENELSPQDKALVQTLRSAIQKATRGPSDVKFIDEGHLKLPQGYLFIPADEGRNYMSLLGNQTGPEFVGMILPEEDPFAWFITIDFIKSGYIKDEDAKNWNPTDLLETIKAGTEEGNKERIKRNIPPIDVVDWIEAPKYDPSSHHLVWSMLLHDRGSPPDAMQTVNYNTYALGRTGYFQLNLVTSDQTVTTDKVHANELIAALEYNPGKTYADFAEGTDHVAEYGLAALVAGVAAKKLGLLALIGVFLIKFSKVALLVGLVSLATARKRFASLFGKRKKDQDRPQDENPPSVPH